MAMNGIILTAALLFLGSTSAGAKCFAQQESEIVYSTATHTATIVSSTQAKNFLCELTVEIKNTVITGFSDVKALCKAPVKSKVALKTRTYCCDDLPKCAESEIVFIQRGKGGLASKRLKAR